jgi:hypothetical protein
MDRSAGYPRQRISGHRLGRILQVAEIRAGQRVGREVPGVSQ